jgi:uncharacterized protein (TIGR03435 family)
MRFRALGLLGVSAIMPALCVVVSLAQTPDSQTFEVVSIKENKSGDQRVQMGFAPGGRFNAVNMPIAGVISIAYIEARPPLAQYRLVDAPSWIFTTRFDIAAKTEGEYQPGSDVPLLRNLLTDRFKLKTHTETRQLPVYELIASRQDKSLGPQLTRSSVDCEVVNGRGALPGSPIIGAPSCQPSTAFGLVTGKAITMRQLATVLSPRVNAIIVDKTGLDGVFDLELKFYPDQVAPVPDAGPSLFTAVQEQLGLRLESTKGLVEVVVIDHIELPTPD